MEKIQRCVYLSKEDYKYLKKNRYSIAKFMRYAIEAHRKGEWNYDDYIEY